MKFDAYKQQIMKTYAELIDVNHLLLGLVNQLTINAVFSYLYMSQIALFNLSNIPLKSRMPTLEKGQTSFEFEYKNRMCIHSNI